MTNLKDALARLIEKSRKRQQEVAESAKGYANLVQSIGLDQAARPNNLRLLRAYMDESQESFMALVGIRSQSSYSKIERGESELTENLARKIETDLGLPTGWLERENGSSLFFSNDEVCVIKELRKAPPDVTLKLLLAIRGFREAIEVANYTEPQISRSRTD